MKKRAREILRQLVSKNEYGQTATVEELAELFQVSVRTIRYDLDQINDYLRQNKLPPVVLGKQGVINVSFSISEVRSSLTQDGFYSIRLSKEERICFEAVLLICQDHFITLSDLADYLFVSRSTIVQDQSALKLFFRENKLYLFSYSKKGLMLEGEEINRRRLLVKMIRQYPSIFSEAPVYHHLMEAIGGYSRQYLEDRELMDKVLNSAEKAFGRFFTDEAYLRLRTYLELSAFRIHSGCVIENVDIKPNHNMEMAATIMQRYGQFIGETIPEEETLYLAVLLNRTRYMKKECSSKEIVKVQVVTMTFIENLSKATGIELQQDYLYL